MRTRPLVAMVLGSNHVACVVGRPAGLGADMPGASVAHLLGSRASGVEVLGTAVVSSPIATTEWPCDPSLLAKMIEQALDATGVTQPLQQAAVALSHPELLHTRVTAQIDLASEPVTIHSRHLLRLEAQAVSQGLGIDWDLLCLEPLGYSGNGFQAVRDPRTLVATRLAGTFQLIGIPRALRRAVTQALDAVGLEVEQLRYGLQATAAASLDESTRTRRLLLLHIGEVCTDVAILDHGCLACTGTIPWGTAHLVSAIAQTCSTTWQQAMAFSLEGPASPKPKVRGLIGKQLLSLQQRVHQVLKGHILPELAVVTGQGALMDGMVEWVEMMSNIKAVLGRSARAAAFGDLSRQVALSPALGLLDLAFAPSHPGSPPVRSHLAPRPARFPSRLVDRLLERTRQILVEYF